MDRIKLHDGEKAKISRLSRYAGSARCDLGRIIMAKADLALHIYDGNEGGGGFLHAPELRHSRRI
jgi:hypothetical protein